MNKRTENVGNMCRTIARITKKSIIKTKHMLILVMFLLLCLFPGITQARGEIPEDIIQEKENSINEIMLGASEGITLTKTYTEGTEAIKLKWNNIEGATKYNIYQSKEGEREKVIATMSSTSVTLNKDNAGIKDEEAPTMPQVTATQTEDGLGNDITLTASTDKGTTYEHYVELAETTNGGYLVFMVDYGKGNSGWVSHAKEAMKEIGRKLIARNIKIGIVVNGGDRATASWDFTNNIETFIKNIDSMYRITHGSMAKRNASC